LSRAPTYNEFFQELEQRMEPLAPPVNLELKRDRWLVGFTALGVLMVLVPWKSFADQSVAFGLTMVGVVLEWIGAALLGYRQVRDVLPEFVNAKKTFASELDLSFGQRERVLKWLRALPLEARQARLAYTTARLESLRSRFAVVFGVADKLGVLPVLVALFFQLQSLSSPTLLAKLLVTAIVILYMMSLWIGGYRTQLEGYERILRAADVTHDKTGNS